MNGSAHFINVALSYNNLLSSCTSSLSATETDYSTKIIFYSHLINVPLKVRLLMKVGVCAHIYTLACKNIDFPIVLNKIVKHSNFCHWKQNIARKPALLEPFFKQLFLNMVQKILKLCTSSIYCVLCNWNVSSIRWANVQCHYIKK